MSVQVDECFACTLMLFVAKANLHVMYHDLLAMEFVAKERLKSHFGCVCLPPLLKGTTGLRRRQHNCIIGRPIMHSPGRIQLQVLSS